MARKQKPEEILGKLREAEIALAQGGGQPSVLSQQAAPMWGQSNCPKCPGPTMWPPEGLDAAGRIGTFSDNRGSKSLGFPRVL
jgi:hypothetical protein